MRICHIFITRVPHDRWNTTTILRVWCKQHLKYVSVYVLNEEYDNSYEYHREMLLKELGKMCSGEKEGHKLLIKSSDQLPDLEN